MCVCVCVWVCIHCMHIYIYMCVMFPSCLAGCHVAHLLLSSCLTLGLSWISLGPRWQWSRQHHFASCHMGRLQGNGAVSVSLELQGLLWHTSTHTQMEYLLSRRLCTVHIKLNKHIKQRRHTDDTIIGRIQTHMHNMLIIHVCCRKYKNVTRRTNVLQFFWNMN